MLKKNSQLNEQEATQNELANTNSLTFLDLFSGVGGFRLGMEKAGH